MVLGIAVCDDEKTELEAISRLTESYFRTRGMETEITAFDSAEKLLRSRKQFDLYLLDVLMPVKDGISAAGMIREMKPDAVIVFITSMLASAVDSYRVEAAGFLLKPVTEETYADTMERLIRNGRIGSRPALDIIYDHMPMSIPLDRIVVLESDLHRVHIRLDGDIYTVHMRLKDLELMLADRKEFLRCHQSFLINLQYADSIVENDFILQRGLKAGIHTVPISRIYLKSSKKAFYDYRLTRGVV